MQSLLASFGDIKDPRAGGGDSFCDRLNCSFTVYLLILFSVIVTTRVYVGDQVSCWCPSHFTDSHVEYTNKVRQIDSKTDMFLCDSMSRFRLFCANLLVLHREHFFLVKFPHAGVPSSTVLGQNSHIPLLFITSHLRRH